MSRELFLARTLIETAVDPYAPPSESDAAASELVAFKQRFGEVEKGGYPVRIEDFDQVLTEDLSALAWLLVLENAEFNDSIVRDSIPEQLYVTTHDEIIRLRLVGATLGHPRTRQEFHDAIEKNPTPSRLEELPDCWAKSHLLTLSARSRAERFLHDAASGEQLREFVLYLLQDGSLAARALAAVSINRDDDWRESARELARGLVLAVDPDLTGYGRLFRRALG